MVGLGGGGGGGAGGGGVKNLCVGICDGAPSTARSSCVFVTFPCGILGQEWYLIVLIPDLCHLSYFGTALLQKYEDDLFPIAYASKKLLPMTQKGQHLLCSMLTSFA